MDLELRILIVLALLFGFFLLVRAFWWWYWGISRMVEAQEKSARCLERLFAIEEARERRIANAQSHAQRRAAAP